MVARLLFILLFFIVNTEIQQVFCKSCSFSRATVKLVIKCPQTLEEWNNEAMLKNCSSITQTCVPDDEFRYHCARNAFSNATVEVCAPIWRSSGFCVEYNEDGEVIQDNYEEPCTNFSIPCPVPYISTDIYKYQECYRLIKSDNLDTVPYLNNERSLNIVSVIVTMCIVVVFMLLSLLLNLVLLKRRFKCRKQLWTNNASKSYNQNTTPTDFFGKGKEEKEKYDNDEKAGQDLNNSKAPPVYALENSSNMFEDSAKEFYHTERNFRRSSPVYVEITNLGKNVGVIFRQTSKENYLKHSSTASPLSSKCATDALNSNNGSGSSGTPLIDGSLQGAAGEANISFPEKASEFSSSGEISDKNVRK